MAAIDKLGHGKASENPLFLNIVVPPSFPRQRKFPVKVYIHGGYDDTPFGSPHHLSGQAQFTAAERSEVWVNIGYRLSAFGFLASDTPGLTGNYGFKDQWLALLWIKANIEAFGGDSDNIQLTGLSAGAHSVHQLLHRVSHLPEGEEAPFQSAQLQSNAILSDPKPPSELQPQYDALCRGLGMDPRLPDTITSLRDPLKTPWNKLTKVVEGLGRFGTFRGCLSPDWTPTNPGPVEWQGSGALGRSLKARGIRSVVIGDLTEEWYLYAIAHPIKGPRDILPNLERYFPTDLAQKLIGAFPPLPQHAKAEEAFRRYGDIMSSGQVHLPSRLLAKDLTGSGLPVLRYEIRWTPEQGRPKGYVTHACDRLLWAFRLPSLKVEQVQVARNWLEKVERETESLRSTRIIDPTIILTLKEDKTIGWTRDGRWNETMSLEGKLSKPHVRSNL